MASNQVVISVNRASPDAGVKAAFRKVVLKVHPDKGGDNAEFQKLQEAKEQWEAAAKSAKSGRPAQAHNRGGRKAPRNPADSLCVDLAEPGESKQQYRIQSYFVLLTYHGFADVAQWERFLEHVEASLRPWSVKHWCATLETTRKGKLHVHVALQFRKKVDRSSRFFAFEGLNPRADLQDVLGEGLNRGKMQLSINRIMFYCFADKDGTVRNSRGEECTSGNYFPAWAKHADFTYPVPGRWPEALWKAHKLSHAKYESYLHLCRDGVLSRKRNLDAVRQKEEDNEEEAEMAAVAGRIRGTFTFAVRPEAEAWLEGFKVERDRYPFLLLVGPSRTGKTEYAKSLFTNPLELKVGKLEQMPDGMRAFSRKLHDGIVLDDIRAFSFLVQHQEKLQSKYDVRLELGTTPGGQCAYHKWLWRIPVVVTANNTTTGHDLLDSDDFLGNPGNRVLLHF